MQKKPDRRVQRTRKSLQDALIELIMEQGYESVNVQDIVDRANIGRSTFYSHYSTKSAVFADGFKSLEEALKISAAQATANGSQSDVYRMNFTRVLFAHVDGHRTLYRALAGERGGILAADHIKKILFSMVLEELDAGAVGKEISFITRDAAIHLVVGATLGLLSWWLDHRNDWSIDEVNDFLQSMITPGLDVLLESS